MDTKSTKTTQKKPTRRRQKQRRISRGVILGQMLFESRWEYGTLTTSTSGTLSAGNISPSISFAYEYSPAQSFFNSVKLVSAVVTFAPIQSPGTGNLNGSMLIGTNKIFNGTTYTNPGTINAVANLDKKAEILCIPTTQVPFKYKMAMNRPLMFSAITGDIPAITSPFEGSPGTVCIWADNLTASTPYFRVHITARWHLRGRN